MKEQINRFARGVFEYNPPVLEASESTVYAVVDRNRKFNGMLNIFEQEGKQLKGVIYSDNDKVILNDSTFLGNRVTIRYSVNCKGALNGDVIEGAFHIVSNGGEKDIPFSFRVEAGSYDSSAGTVRNLFHFANLAQKNPEEAITLMEEDDFKDVYLGDDMHLRCIYEGIMKGKDSRNNLEEFLIAIHKKTRINISIPINNRVFEATGENFKDTVLIERDTWGYSNVLVSCDSPFVRLERREIASDSFAGNKYEFSYIVEYDKLHQGRNCAVINFETVNRTVSYTVTVIKGQSSQESKNRRMEQKLNCDLMALYIKFRAHLLNLSEWIRETKIVLEAVRAINDDNPFYRLALAQIYIVEKKDTEAKWLIENVKDEIDSDNVSSYPLYCYYIYVNTLYNKDRLYSQKASAIVKECYVQNEDYRILWTLLFMDEEFEQNPSLKLIRIKEQFNRGCSSPALYIEACNILNEHPVLLRVLNSFEINVLYFGIKYGMAGRKLCRHAAELVMSARTGSVRFVRLMMSMYDCYKDTDILEGLCKLLIRNHCIGNKYLPYYELGIRNELKITQLFEAYIESGDLKNMAPLPKMVLMYFGYNNSLDYQRKAYLYANIIHNKVDNPQVYRSYLPQINSFVSEQLMLGHVNDQLAILYENILNTDMIDEENAGPVSEIFFTYRIECSNPLFRKVVVRHKESNSEKEYPVNNGVAYVKMYTDDATVLFISDRLNRYSVPYSAVRFMEDDSIMQKCLEADDNLMHLKLHSCEKTIRYQKRDTESIQNIINMASMSEISLYYRRMLNSVIIDYYYDSYDVDGFNAFMKNTGYDLIEEKEIPKLIEIYIVQGDYEKAFELIQDNSYMQVIPKRLMKLCSRLILSGQHENSELLMNMCSYVFKKGRYDELILGYLADGYNGTTEEMLTVWKRAVEFDIDTYELEERIIAQMMFSHSYFEIMADVFDNYFRKGPKDRIVEAYLSYNSYLYFVKEVNISETVFTVTEAYLENEKDLPWICRMALIKYYSELSSLSEYRKNLGTETIAALIRKEYVFPFFLKLADKIPLPYEITDKTMVEYRANPKKRVVIHYVYEDREHKKNYITEDMKNVYEGIFVKQFVLFYGERIQYYITEEDKDGEKTGENRSIINQSIKPDKSEGRYEALNDIIACRDMHDGQTFQKLIHTYAVTEYVAGQIFKPL
ncbi:MAG: DUF5717 family protein [Butyrivibrio sp.]